MAGINIEDPPLDLILEVVDSEMGPKQPKVLLFDIGGVCVSWLKLLRRIYTKIKIPVVLIHNPPCVGCFSIPGHSGLRTEPRCASWLGELLHLQIRSQRRMAEARTR